MNNKHFLYKGDVYFYENASIIHQCNLPKTLCMYNKFNKLLGNSLNCYI